MTVRKRDGSTEPVNLNKIVRAIRLASEGLTRVDPMRVATKTISGLYDGASTKELDQLSIQTSASLVTEEPEYGRLAARLSVLLQQSLHQRKRPLRRAKPVTNNLPG